MNKLLECVHCGWVHFAVTREHAEAEVAQFNEYYHSLSAEDQNKFYGGTPSNIQHYEYCNFCGQQADMKPATKSVLGSTVGHIIWEKED